MKRVKHDLHLLRTVAGKVRRVEHRALARLGFAAHLAYYGLVSVEAHGTYRYVAGGLGLLLILESMTGGGEP